MKRKKWNKCETEILMKHFHAETYPEREEYFQLSKSLNTSFKRVGNWFTKMRCKKRAEGMLFEGE